MSMFSGMTFPDYEFREYPKFIQTGQKKDPKSGEVTVIGITVANAAEEAEVKKTGKEPERGQDELARLKELAKAKGVNIDARWGTERIKGALAEANVPFAAPQADPTEDEDA